MLVHEEVLAGTHVACRYTQSACLYDAVLGAIYTDEPVNVLGKGRRMAFSALKTPLAFSL